MDFTFPVTNCHKWKEGLNSFFSILFFNRFSEKQRRTGVCPLSSRHLPLCNHLSSLSDAHQPREAGRGLWVCQEAPQHHLSQLQLHGPAPPVRVPGSGLVHLLLRGGQSGNGQQRNCVQLSRLHPRALLSQPAFVPPQSHHHLAELLRILRDLTSQETL